MNRVWGYRVVPGGDFGEDLKWPRVLPKDLGHGYNRMILLGSYQGHWKALLERENREKSLGDMVRLEFQSHRFKWLVK